MLLLILSERGNLRIPKWNLALAILAVLAVLATGCGGGGDDTSSAGGGGSSEDTISTAPLSKAAYQEKAREICEESRATYLKEAEKALFAAQGEGEPRKEIELRLIGEMLIPQMEQRMEKLRQLTPPPADEAKVDKILSAVEEVIEKAKADPAKFAQEQATFKRPFEEASNLAKGYSLSLCAEA